ncbi:bile acid:sodium symporter family protein [Candidatus Pelagibacter sp. HIMB1782]|uniref:bile acid:sodium symporter family protein n=1 Tax=Candidatus Pelagibacter sp. HIMB1782 TaxID=3413375 RepID=UPI003F8643F5
MTIKQFFMETAKLISPIALALIMLGLGTSLKIDNFLRVFRYPKDFFVGLFCQMIILPIIAFLLIKIINIPTEIALGVMIIAAAPGGVTSNILTKFANGDVALSISLTAIISLISIFSVPFIIFFSADLLNIDYVQKNISILSISLKMFFVVTIPVIVGMIIRHYANNFVLDKTKTIQRISVGLFIIVFISIYIEEWDKIVNFLIKAGTISLVLNITMMTVGFYIAKFFASGVAQQKCISLECGLQNGTLAVFVGTQLFDEIVYMVPTAAYALIMMITSILFLLLIRKLN